jgi:hypothetical protein
VGPRCGLRQEQVLVSGGGRGDGAAWDCAEPRPRPPRHTCLRASRALASAPAALAAGATAPLTAWAPHAPLRYFLRKLRRVKKANGQVIAVNEVSAWPGSDRPAAKMGLRGRGGAHLLGGPLRRAEGVARQRRAARGLGKLGPPRAPDMIAAPRQEEEGCLQFTLAAAGWWQPCRIAGWACNGGCGSRRRQSWWQWTWSDGP